MQMVMMNRLLELKDICTNITVMVNNTRKTCVIYFQVKLNSKC